MWRIGRSQLSDRPDMPPLPDDPAERLRFFADLPTDEQMKLKPEIEATFRVFWAGCPDEDAFAHAAPGLLMTTRILYIMTTPRLP